MMTCQKTIKISTCPELVACLQKFNVPTAQWAQKQAKSVSDLWREVELGESHLMVVDGQLVRRVHSLAIDVWHRSAQSTWQYLYEEKQVFADGRIRQRSLRTSLAEKLRAGEAATYEAVARALREELGLTNVPRKKLLYIGTWSEVRPSNSYIGLVSQHIFSHWRLLLPKQHYRIRYQETQPTKVTTWVWRTIGVDTKK